MLSRNLSLGAWSSSGIGVVDLVETSGSEAFLCKCEQWIGVLEQCGTMGPGRKAIGEMLKGTGKRDTEEEDRKQQKGRGRENQTGHKKENGFL